MSAYQFRFKAFLAEPLERVFALLETSLGSDIALLDATNRSLLAQGGKRIRPGLTLLAAGACGGVNGDTVRFAAAAEMIHNATLLHDDVVDGATTRRGKPTVMSILSSPASVLIGDYWLVKAIRCILDADRYSERAIRLFAKTLSDLAEGEMLQLEKASSCDTTRQDYLRIVYSKTASLFEASVLAGAVSADAPEEWTAALAGYARNLGIAFQIKDDILDYAGDAALGKPVGIDLKEQKITLTSPPWRTGSGRSSWKRAAWTRPRRRWVNTSTRRFPAWTSFRRPRKNRISRNWPAMWAKEIIDRWKR